MSKSVAAGPEYSGRGGWRVFTQCLVVPADDLARFANNPFAVLRAAQREPEKHRDLIVRVAGYSDYFCDLTKALQDEIIARTEHTAV